MIVPMLMRIGSAVVRMDGIGGVSTEEEFRNRGYSRRVMETAVQQMRQGDAALSTLFGIEDFYQKFGYETTGPEYTVVLPLADAAMPTRSPHGWRFRPLITDDMPAVTRLYHANTRRATGALVRHDAGDDPSETDRLAGVNPDARKIGLRAWNRLRAVAVDPGRTPAACSSTSGAGSRPTPGSAPTGGWASAGVTSLAPSISPRGWPRMPRRPITCSRHAGPGPAKQEAIAIRWRWRFRRKVRSPWPRHTRVGRCSVSTPEAATSWGGCSTSAACCGSCCPSWRRECVRLACRSRAASPFRTDEGEAEIVLTENDVLVDGGADREITVELPQTALARLCLGGFDPTDVLARLPTPPDPEVEGVLRVLFPRRMPHLPDGPILRTSSVALAPASRSLCSLCNLRHCRLLRRRAAPGRTASSGDADSCHPEARGISSFCGVRTRT